MKKETRMATQVQDQTRERSYNILIITLLVSLFPLACYHIIFYSHASLVNLALSYEPNLKFKKFEEEELKIPLRK
jgi:hypothetical protein